MLLLPTFLSHSLGQTGPAWNYLQKCLSCSQHAFPSGVCSQPWLFTTGKQRALWESRSGGPSTQAPPRIKVSSRPSPQLRERTPSEERAPASEEVMPRECWSQLEIWKIPHCGRGFQGACLLPCLLPSWKICVNFSLKNKKASSRCSKCIKKSTHFTRPTQLFFSKFTKSCSCQLFSPKHLHLYRALTFVPSALCPSLGAGSH